MNAHLSLSRNQNDYIRGNPAGRLELIEYGDYQCPYCLNASYVINQLMEAFPAQLCFAFRHFPIVEHHPLAMACAVAAEAAGRQGRYWDMHDLLWQHQKGLTSEGLFKLATSLSLNMRQFRLHMQDERLGEKVMEQRGKGLEIGVLSTPTFFVNGKKYEGELQFAGLKEALQSGELVS
ncbi:MAG: thioredoxin domain-containing protein [Bacteroidota bacterium]